MAEQMTLEQKLEMLNQLPQMMAAQAPTMDDPYALARQEFFNADRLLRKSVSAVNTALSSFGASAPGMPKKKQEDEPYQVSATGKIMYENGVIFDPNAPPATAILTPPGKAVPGSREWLLKIQDEWTATEANRWRKKLAKQGYEVAEKGGMAHDLLAALDNFHKARYTNFGKVQPLAPAPDVTTREAIRDSMDYKTLKSEVKAWGQVPFGEDLSDEEADWFADKLVNKMTQLARKHPNWSMEQVQAGAQTRVQEQFVEQPQVKALIQEQEDQEVSYKIRDSILGVSQLLGA